MHKIAQEPFMVINHDLPFVALTGPAQMPFDQFVLMPSE